MQVWSSPARFLEAFMTVLLFLMVEVNAFFLKFILWVPPLNPLNTLRLLIWFGLALPATKEYYAFIEGADRNVMKLGAFAWLAAALAFVETMIAIKFGRGMFPKPWPMLTLQIWAVVLTVLGSLFTAWSVKFYLIDKRHLKGRTGHKQE